MNPQIVIYDEMGNPLMYADRLEVMNQSPEEALSALIREALAITRAHLQSLARRHANA